MQCLGNRKSSPRGCHYYYCCCFKRAIFKALTPRCDFSVPNHSEEGTARCTVRKSDDKDQLLGTHPKRAHNPSKGRKEENGKAITHIHQKQSLSNRKVEETKREKASFTRVENVLNLTILQ